MNIEDLLNEVESAMLECTDHSAYRYHLYLLKEELLLRPALLVPTGSIIIYSMTRQQLDAGLTHEEWNELADKITKVYKELKLWPTPQKP